MTNYDPANPQSTQLLSQSQPIILNNFFELNDQFGKDHIPFLNSGSNGNGHHKQVTIDVASAPTAAGTVGVYHTTAGSTGSEFATGVVPTFANSLGDFIMLPNKISNGTQFCYKIGNIIYQWGSASVTLGTPLGISLNLTNFFPYTSASTYFPQVTLGTAFPSSLGQSFALTAVNVDGNSFTINLNGTTGGTYKVNYFIIGT